MKILVTGAAGFIGMHVAKALLERGDEVIGVDNLNDYYDVQLKLSRLEILRQYPHFKFIEDDIADRKSMRSLFDFQRFDVVVNLAAQSGVRYSIENPSSYIDSNLVGFANILEGCRQTKVKHLVYASSSSVYGSNEKTPYSTQDNVDHPVSLYAATKKANEVLAHSYSHLYNLPTTGLRFFTVYGPWGRPDMAPSLFTDAILNDKPMNVFNNGEMERDFTYIDDIVESVVRVIDQPAEAAGTISNNPAESNSAPYKVYNIGNNETVNLMDFIKTIEDACGKEGMKNMMDMQNGDVVSTFADIDSLYSAVGFKPTTKLKDGMEKTVAWYREYHNL